MPPQEATGSSGTLYESNTTLTFEEVDGSENAVGHVKRFKSKMTKLCSKETLFRRIRVLEWLPKYNREDVVGDMVAGITLGLSIIPASLSYVNIAGLPSQYGLYSSFLGQLIYIVFGTCKEFHMGCTPIVSLLTLQAVHGMGPDFAVLLCFFTGIVQVAMGLLGLGFIIDFISRPVSVGFTYAILLFLVTAQLKDALGIPVKGFTFTEQWSSIAEHVGETQVGDVVVTLACAGVILALQFMDRIRVGKLIDEEKHPRKKSLCEALNKTIWLMSVSRFAIVLVVFSCIGYFFSVQGNVPFKTVGYVPSGLPKVQPPVFETTTNGTHYDFVDMLSELGWSTFVVPLLSMLETLAIARFFSNGNAIDVKQELLAVGTCNLCNSFVQAYPGGGSFTRSIVFQECQVRTPLANLYSSLISVSLLLFFSETLHYIPKASLAAILLVPTVQMLEVRTLRNMWKTKKSDLVPATVTFLACLLLRIEVGIVIGIVVNLLLVIYQTGRPNLQVKILKNEAGAEYLLVSPDRWIIFTSAERFRNSVMKHATRKLPVFVDCARIYKADYTSAVVVESMLRDFKKRRQLLAFYNLKSEVRHVLSAMSSEKLLICESQEDIDSLLTPKLGAENVGIAHF